MSRHLSEPWHFSFWKKCLYSTHMAKLLPSLPDDRLHCPDHWLCNYLSMLRNPFINCLGYKSDRMILERSSHPKMRGRDMAILDYSFENYSSFKPCKSTYFIDIADYFAILYAFLQPMSAGQTHSLLPPLSLPKGL